MAFLDETGLTHLWGKITGKFLAKSNVANNLTTTAEGYALDARQGVALMNAISSGGGGMKLSGDLVTKTQYGSGSTTITLEKDAFCSFYAEGNLDSGSDYSLKAYVNVNSVTICKSNGSTVVKSTSKSWAGLTSSAFMVLPKGAIITLNADSSPSTSSGHYKSTANAIIQYFE